MSELLSVEAFCERQGIDFDPTNIKAVRAVQDASAFVRSYTHQMITFVADDVVVLDGRNRSSLLLPERPVVEVCSVTVISLDATETELETTDYRVDRADILHRLDGGVFCDEPANVSVIYDHGYVSVLESLVAVTYELAAENYVSTGSGAVTSETIGGYSVTYDAASAGTAELPDTIRYVLDCYKDHR